MNELRGNSQKEQPAVAIPVMATKVRVPRRRPDLLLRPRLLNFLHMHLDRKVILISAPAGYGKTSLLSDFARDCDLPVCWYSLDMYDNDLRVFLEYLVAAIAEKFPSFGPRTRSFLHSLSDPASQLYQIASMMVQEIHDVIPEYFILVIDDHQMVENQEQVNEYLDLFITYVDENCHVVIASRTLPALPNMSLLVARRQAAGISLDELRFTPKEVQDLVSQNYSLSISRQQAEQVVANTGGWITGMLLSINQFIDIEQPEKVPRGQIQMDLFEYFSKQVLNQQTAEIRQFLLLSSILDVVNPTLCRVILGLDQVNELMDQVRLRNLFIIEYEGDAEGFRYHDLFREFLRTYLRKQDELQFKKLLKVAGQVYSQQGDWDRAMGCYFSLPDYESAALLLEQEGERFYRAGRWDSLVQWIQSLPRGESAQHPVLLDLRGRIHAERGDPGKALELFSQAEAGFTRRGNIADSAKVIALRAGVQRYTCNYPEAISLCERVLGMGLGDTVDERATIALAKKNLGLCMIETGRLSEGQELLKQALEIYQYLDDIQNTGMVQHDLGLSYELNGDLKQATEYYTTALKCWEEIGNPSPWANSLNSLGVVYYLLGQYERARTMLEQALLKAQQVQDVRIQSYILASLADLHRDLGKLDAAESLCFQALKLAQQAKVGFIICYAEDGLANLSLLKGDIHRAKDSIDHALATALGHDSVYEIAMCHITRGIVYYTSMDTASAEVEFKIALEQLKNSDINQLLSRAWMHLAQTRFLQGDLESALSCLDQAFELSSRLGYDQFLVVEGVQLQTVLDFALSRGFQKEKISALLPRIIEHKQLLQVKSEPVLPAEPSQTIRITALGKPGVWMNGQPVQWALIKSRDVFFFILQNPHGVSREEIGTVFWPEHTPEKLEMAFRSTLYRLRRDTYRECIYFEEGVYRFNIQNPYWYDVEDFETLIRLSEESTDPVFVSQRCQEAIGLYKGHYLQGIYEDWVVLERERLRNHYLSLLERIAKVYTEQRKLPQAIEHYQKLISEEPYLELAHQELMRLFFRQGNRAAAIRQYLALAKMLEDELGLRPNADTQALYLRIIG